MAESNVDGIRGKYRRLTSARRAAFPASTNQNG
jgi:hypothetical protein